MQFGRKKGFTLIEIMIVVVLIGILATLAMPLIRKARTQAAARLMLNDARQIGAAVQNYYLEQGITSVVIAVDPDTGIITGPISEYITSMSKSLDLSGSPITIEEGEDFALEHSMGVITFNERGQALDASGPVRSAVPGFE